MQIDLVKNIELKFTIKLVIYLETMKHDIHSVAVEVMFLGSFSSFDINVELH